MATTLGQKLYSTTVNGLPSLSFMSDISQDPNAAYLQSQYKEVTSADQLRALAAMAQGYYGGLVNRYQPGDSYRTTIENAARTSGFYGQDLSALDQNSLLAGLKNAGYFQGDLTQAQQWFQGITAPSQYANLTPEEQKQYGFDSPFVSTSSLQSAQQQQADLAAGKLVQVGTMPKADGTVQPLYAPVGSPAALKASGQTPTADNISKDWLAQNPKINIPATIPTDVFSSTATKDSVLASLPNLQPGMSSPEVKKLQEELIRMGLMPTGMNTGYYGDITKAAVAKLQSTLGVDTAGNDGYFGPRTKAALSTPEGVAKLSSQIKDSTAGATDVGSALASGNKSLQQAGIPELKIDPSTPLSTSDIPDIFTKYVAMQGSIQQKIDAAQEELTKIMSDATRGANKISGGLGVTQTLIGRQLQNLKDVVAIQAQPYSDLISNLTKDLGITRDTMNTLMAYGNYVKGLNKPEYMTVGKNLIQIMPDGTVKTVYSAPGGGGDPLTSADVGYSLSPENQGSLRAAGREDIVDRYLSALQRGDLAGARAAADEGWKLLVGSGQGGKNTISIGGESIDVTPNVRDVWKTYSGSGKNELLKGLRLTLSDGYVLVPSGKKDSSGKPIIEKQTLDKSEKVMLNDLVNKLSMEPDSNYPVTPPEQGVFSKMWDWTKSTATGLFPSATNSW